VVGPLLAFRLIYFLAPLLLGLVLFGAAEAVFRPPGTWVTSTAALAMTKTEATPRKPTSDTASST
jgi:hypothetical protein